jgi:hypothetical protein
LNWIVVEENLVVSLGVPILVVNVFIVKLNFDLFAGDS